MDFQETDLNDCYLITPKVFADERGYFFESYSIEKDKIKHLHEDWVQDNEAKSNRGVIRGLHFQKGNAAQAKLVRVISGSVQDIVIDMRKSSPSFGSSYSIVLSAENKKQLFVPRGFAHGYAVLEDNTVFAYKCDNNYQPKTEGGLLFNDPSRGIEWLVKSEDAVVSEKDLVLPNWENSYYFD